MGVPWDSLPDLDSVTVLSAEALASVTAKEGAVELSIFAMSQTFVATYSLPAAGELIIGRSNTVGIYVDDQLVSRRHAIITAGPKLTIRDLGSSNGTLVAGLPLEPNVERTLDIGDVVLVGGTALLIQHRTSTVHPRTFWTQSQFESRLLDECARAVRAKREFTVAILDLGRHASDMMGRQILAAELRKGDVVGVYGASAYLFLLDVSGEQALIMMQQITDALLEREIVGRWGVAQFPKDGQTGDELIARSRPAPAAKTIVTTGTIIADPRTQELFRTAERIAAGDISVLIVGETGVGKEVMAEEIHRRSKRANQPFLRINCGALSETLLESELFGHERGAFTSAVAAKPGLLETADHGTVMLDEIGEMPTSLQVKLLRVLEEHQVRRVGGVKSRALDVRFLAATNRDLARSVACGLFRQDLYYRLAGATIEIPPLRDRPADLEPLIRNFLHRASRHLEHPPTITDETITRLRGHNWPGNIRELRHVIDRAVLLAGTGPITVAHLPALTRNEAPVPVLPSPTPPNPGDELERVRLITVLAECGGNQSRAAKQLGMSRGALIRRLEMYGIVRPRKPD